MLNEKNILIGISGGIAAYKMCDLVRLFKKNGANVKVVITENAEKFVTPLSLETVSQETVYKEQFHNCDKKPEHIALCDWADVFLIAPASANTIGKVANGICDNLLTSLACAFQKQMFYAPSMNTGMWNNKFVQQNIEKLKVNNAIIIEPEVGHLACGTSGKGRLPDLNSIYCKIENYFENEENLFLKGKRIVVTAGGTKENFDPVRYIGNYSSGKMGTAIADKAFEAGADVCLIKTFDLTRNYKTIDVKSAAQMYDAVQKAFENADILIMTAAVADYRPEEEAFSKIKKENTDKLVLNLVKNPDILTEMCKIKTPNQQIVGFCAESDNLLDNAKHKIQKKKCDYIVANDISRKDTGFSSDYNEVYVIDKDLNIQKIEKNTKDNIAQKLLETIWQKQVK